MLKASNNHFGDICKIKILKIRAFCNLKSAKIAKKMRKNIFSVIFGTYDMHKTFYKLHQMKEEIKRINLAYIFLSF